MKPNVGYAFALIIDYSRVLQGQCFGGDLILLTRIFVQKRENIPEISTEKFPPDQQRFGNVTKMP